MRPQRIEMEQHVAAGVAGLVAEILAPIGAIGDRRLRRENLSRIGGQRAKLLHERESTRAVAQRGQAAQLGPDQEGVDATRRLGQIGEVQHEAAVAPVARRARKADRVLLSGEVARLRVAAERVDLASRGIGLVG